MIIVVLVVLGLALGSFTNALVWRLHQQTANKKKPKPKDIDKLSITRGRSMCPNCKHQLAAKDLVPVLSWLSLNGKCRYCHKPVSWQYPVVELVTACLFVISYLFWPYEFNLMLGLQFTVWLAILVVLMALLVYDLRWMLLPNKLVYIFSGLAAAFVVIEAVSQGSLAPIWGGLVGALCLAGLFFAIFQLSKGQWIGGGDVKLAVGLGLIVGGPLNAVLLLFFASVGGSLASIPLLLGGRAGRRTPIPFGPFLIAAGVLVYLFGQSINNWYVEVILGL